MYPHLLIKGKINTLYSCIALYLVGAAHILLIAGIVQCLFYSILFLLSYSVLREHIFYQSLFKHFWSVFSFGGIGMFLGHWIDSGTSAQAHSHHHHMHHHTNVPQLVELIASATWSNMMLFMILFCLPSCYFFCNQYINQADSRSKFSIYGITTFAMITGMLLAVILEQSVSAHLTLTPMASHLNMVFFMALFSTGSFSICKIYFCCHPQIATTSK